MTTETGSHEDDLLHEVALARQQRLRDSMRALGIPAVLVLDPVNILYATGASNMTLFSTRVAARYLLLFAEGPSILFEYFGCEHLAEGLPTLDSVRPARGLCHVSSGGDSQGQARALVADISAVLGDTDLSVDTLAIDRFPYVAVDALRAGGFRLEDADAVFSQARRVKLPGEIVLMREAVDRVVAASQKMAGQILPGRSEIEIWSDFIAPFIADEGRYVTTRLVQGGPRSFPYFQEAGSRPLHSGELLCFDTDAVGYAGYCVDFSRSYLCGDAAPSQDQLRLHALAREQLEHNIELVRPGASYAEIAAAAWPVPEAHQDSRYYCVGHALGMSGEVPNIPHWRPGEPYPLDGELEAGMVFCVESYIGSARTRQGIKLEEQLLITDTGVERLSAAAPFDARLETATG